MAQLIPFDDRDGYIWMDGKMLPWREARMHILSHGLHYGGSVFEGIRVYDGQIFKLREHSERLLRSANLVDFEIPWSLQDIEETSQEIIEANKIVNGYLRPVAWRGSEQMAVTGSNCSVHLAFATWPWPKYFFPKGGEGKGVALQTSQWVRPDPRSMPVQSKSSGIYMVGTMAKQIAERAGFDDALLHDFKGRVAESTGSNLFVVQDGMLRTPEPECFLNGITRQTIIGLARDLGLKVEVGTIMPDELKEVDEVFLTGTAAEVAPVGKIDDIEYAIGPVTRKLEKAYGELVRSKPASVAAE